MFTSLSLLLGVKQAVGRSEYAAAGFGLMLVKYVVESLIIWIFAGEVFTPWHFLNPVLSIRAEMLDGAPPVIGWTLFVWSLPFLWIAISMSVRRAADAGLSPWSGLLVLVPIVNLGVMIAFCFVPSSKTATWGQQDAADDQAEAEPETSRAIRAVVAIGLSLMFGATMMVLCVLLLESYGASLFLGAPLLMGAIAAHQFNRGRPQGYGASVGLGFSAVFFGCVALLLFALEGVICIAMAAPLMLPLGALGGLIGKAIADATRRSPHELMAVVLMLPVLALIETRFTESTEYEVMTSVEIDAPPEVVWNHVVDFPDLPPPKEWYFRTGIACPQRARIVGEGVGAVRHCEFTTGTFVEPITVWEPGQRLAFNVTEQPAPMFELSPYRHVHPPHLDGYLRSNRGEFRLIAMADGRTRLEGSTWYEFDMFPQSYWTLWSNLLIHRIHERVLVHIQDLSESEAK